MSRGHSCAEVGQVNGRLTVIRVIPGCTLPDGTKIDKRIECQCDCGNTCVISAYNLKRTSSCGCLRSPSLIGMRFGRLVVIDGPFKQPKTLLTLYKYRCDCGTERIVSLTSLKMGRSKSCGCATHGSNHHQWRGGTEEEIALRQKNKPRAAWARHVKRKQKSCAVCGRTDCLEAHHIYLYHTSPALRYVEENGIALCVRCHNEYHRQHGKIESGIGHMAIFLNARGGDDSRIFPLIDLFREDWKRDESSRLFTAGCGVDDRCANEELPD